MIKNIFTVNPEAWEKSEFCGINFVKENFLAGYYGHREKVLEDCLIKYFGEDCWYDDLEQVLIAAHPNGKEEIFIGGNKVAVIERKTNFS